MHKALIAIALMLPINIYAGMALTRQNVGQQAQITEVLSVVTTATSNEAADLATPELTQTQSTQTDTILASRSTVVVQPGDTLSTIAERYNTTYKKLYDANETLSDPDVLIVGSSIVIPAEGEVFAERQLPVKQTPVAQTVQPVSQPTPSSAPVVADGSVWDRLAACESGGNWSINTGNGYYGGLQFSLSTWRAVGGVGLPSENSREEQIARAEILLARSGFGQWPACSAKLGLL
jgi:LysM repeat protein